MAPSDRPPAAPPAPPPSTSEAPAPWPLWPLALLAGLLPVVATLLAWSISTAQGLIPACIPFIDGCVSVSRAAREGLANTLFRALVLPAAVLQGLVWLCPARWLGTMLPPYRLLDALAPLGLVVALALVAYGAFLGTEGPAYRWLRRWGTIVYFGGTCVCLLIAGGGVQRAVRAGKLVLARVAERALVGLAAALVGIGLVHALLAAVFGEPLKGRVENMAEWWAALIFQLGFLALAFAWWRTGVVLGLASTAPPAGR